MQDDVGKAAAAAWGGRGRGSGSVGQRWGGHGAVSSARGPMGREYDATSAHSAAGVNLGCGQLDVFVFFSG